MNSNKEIPAMIAKRYRSLNSSDTTPVRGRQQPQRTTEGNVVAIRFFSSPPRLPTLMTSPRSSSSSSSSQGGSQVKLMSSMSSGRKSEDHMTSTQSSPVSSKPLRLHVTNLPFRFRYDISSLLISVLTFSYQRAQPGPALQQVWLGPGRRDHLQQAAAAAQQQGIWLRHHGKRRGR